MKFYFKKDRYFDKEYEEQLMVKDLERFNVKVILLETTYYDRTDNLHDVAFLISGNIIAYNKLKKAYKCTSVPYKGTKMLLC